MIYIDPLNKEKYMPSAHLISSLSGCAGRKELIEFAVKVFGISKFQRWWIQNPGTKKEYLNIWGRYYEKAIKKGAKRISTRELVRIMGQKKVAIKKYIKGGKLYEKRV